ncbi:MAG: cysteine protease StiP family protein [Ruminococcus sp.]|nr:cysteine protease StiP family protein [Ruminococcus sp.]
MRTSYRPEDVTVLLKDITGLVQPMENIDRERMIQSGVHYSEMIPREHLPSEEYLQTFFRGLEKYSEHTARAAVLTAEKIYADKGENAVLVSLARAGTPVGIIIKHFFKRLYGIDPPHYTISIIRGKGIDDNAMKYILERHEPRDLQFIDGWTGKGAIQRQLLEAMKPYPGVDPTVAVLSDPAHVAGICGTHADFMIPSSCLNSTVSGLMSRTFRRPDLIGKDDFDGALCYEEFAEHDLSYRFIDEVEKHFDSKLVFPEDPDTSETALREVQGVAEHFGIADINFVKPGIGETTRVLLRRIPWKILVHSLDDDEHLGHIYQLAEEKGVQVEVYPLRHYRACGLIKALADT